MPDFSATTTRRELFSPLQASATPEDARPDDTASSRLQPSAGATIRLSTRAMACDFSVIMNPGPTERIESAGESLERIHAIEGWLSIYRDSSELSQVNRHAWTQQVSVRGQLLELLTLSRELHERTDGAFDMASGSLTRLWKQCRQADRVPLQDEIDEALSCSGMHHVALFPSPPSVRFHSESVLLDPGAIGKGFALDEACRALTESENGPDSFVLHGGHSSLLARGGHNGYAGWPIGVGNPLFTEKRLGTLLLCNRAMATSGSNIQFFRHKGRRYGHILDPRNGWPVEGMLSVTVLAPSAAIADALATAFFVLGVEKAKVCCENWPDVGAILIPFPVQGRRVTPTVIGIPDALIVWDQDQVAVSSC